MTALRCSNNSATCNMKSSVKVLEEFISSFTQYFDVKKECLLFFCKAEIYSKRQHFTCHYCGVDRVLVTTDEWSRDSIFQLNKRRKISCDKSTAHTDGLEHKEKQNELFRDLRSLQRVLVRFVRLCSQGGEFVAANQITN
jgi:hypothetical protein